MSAPSTAELTAKVVSDAAHRLAYLLRAIEDEERAFKDKASEHRDNMQRLRSLVYKVRQEILTGQSTLIDVMTELSEENA
jgi:hypothetical protein